MLGICNGFQILCEAHLLPGALIRNDVRVFVHGIKIFKWSRSTPPGHRTLPKPGHHARAQEREGGYVADEETLRRLEARAG